MSTKVLYVDPDLDVPETELMEALCVEGFSIRRSEQQWENLHLSRDDQGWHFRAARLSKDLPPDCSLETLVFWANDFYYERQRHAGPRRPCVLSVELVFDDGRLQATTTDISAHGLFVATNHPRSVGRMVTVLLRQQAGSTPLRCLGRVVHVVRAQDGELRGEHGGKRCGHPGLAIELLAPHAQIVEGMTSLLRHCQQGQPQEPAAKGLADVWTLVAV